MSNKSNPPATEAISSKIKTQPPKWLGRMLPFGAMVSISTIACLMLLNQMPWLIKSQSQQEIASLKTIAQTLSNRVDHLEESLKTPADHLMNPNLMNEIDKRLTALSEQIEVIRNEPKTALTEHADRSQVFHQTLEKETQQLLVNQKTLRTILLFWRLKAKILSDAPYGAELTDFKSVAHDFGSLSLLDKFADQGLQSLNNNQEIQPPQSVESQSGSLWNRLKVMASSLIKVEKINPLPSAATPPSNERRDIENVLNDFDHTLIHQLTTMPITPSPQPGGAS
jgi:hypothetical protein